MRTLLAAGVVLASFGPPLAAQRELAVSKLGGGFLDLSTHLANRDTDAAVELREPSHESWVTMHCGPLERALRGKLEKLAPK